MTRFLSQRTTFRLAASLLMAFACSPASTMGLIAAAQQNSNCPGSSLQITPIGFGNTIISLKVWMVRADNKQEVDFFPRCAGTASQIDCPQLGRTDTAYVHFSQGGMNADNVESVIICVGARQYKFSIHLDDPRNNEVAGSFSCTPKVPIGRNEQFSVPRVGTGPSATINISTSEFGSNRGCKPMKADIYNVSF
jgi:hypothetical protein